VSKRDSGLLGQSSLGNGGQGHLQEKNNKKGGGKEKKGNFRAKQNKPSTKGRSPKKGLHIRDEKRTTKKNWKKTSRRQLRDLAGGKELKKLRGDPCPISKTEKNQKKKVKNGCKQKRL